MRTPCSRCGALGWERLERTSLYERLVLPFFGLYPWRCALCNRRRYLPYRADPRTSGYRG